MKFIVAAITLLFTHNLHAQDSSRIFLNAGTSISDIAVAKKYRFKEFKQGQVLFNDNRSHTGLLNYNFLNGEIMFTAAVGDTLAIAKDQMLNIKRVTIDTASYVYNNGYMELIRENKTGTLAKKQQFFVVAKEKIGGYNIASETSSIDSYSSFMDREDNQHKLAVRENITLQLKTDYYIGDVYNHFLLVNRKNLDKIFFKKREQLNNYLKEHTVDLRKETDVISLFIFLTETM